MTYEEWLQDEFPGGVDDEKREWMRLAWEACVAAHAPPQYVGPMPTVPDLRPRMPPTPLTPCIGVPVIPARDDTNKTSDLSGNVRKPGASAVDGRVHPARDSAEGERS